MRPLAATLLLLIASNSAAYACRCQPRSLPEYFRAADIVMLIEVVAVAEREGEGGESFREAQPRVIENFKGGEGLRYVRSPVSSAACGIPMKAEERYWVFAQRRLGEAAAWIATAATAAARSAPTSTTSPAFMSPRTCAG